MEKLKTVKLSANLTFSIHIPLTLFLHRDCLHQLSSHSQHNDLFILLSHIPEPLDLLIHSESD